MSRKSFNNFVKKFPSRLQIDEHDNRVERSEHTIRRVQDSRGRIVKKSQDSEKWSRIKDRLGNWDDDTVMEDPASGGAGGSGRFQRGGGRGRGIRNLRIWKNTTVFENMKKSHWYQITVVNGARHGRDAVLAAIERQIAPQKYYPVCYQMVRNDAEFYVETFHTAQLVLSCTRKIVVDGGEPLSLRLKSGRPPYPPVDSVTQGKIKEAMAKRYNSDTKALDLSRFHRDPMFLDGMFNCLNRGPVLSSVMKVIIENIPDLVALDLSGNMLNDLDAAAQEFKQLKSLKILHLPDNQISLLKGLNCLQGSGIIELVLKPNPVCNSFADQSHFVSEIRKRFPRLTKLDNVELTPLVTFDVPDEDVLPVPAQTCILTAEATKFVEMFVGEYLKIYDSDNRSNLLQAYATNCFFSYTCESPSYPPYGPRLNSYFSDARNLLRLSDFPRRKKRLIQGQVSVVDFLCKSLPKSQHDLPTLAVDVPTFLPNLIHMTISGFFRETGLGSPENWPLRYFFRSFIIAPLGSGYCILNDMLHITNCTDEQKRKAFKLAQPNLTAAPAVAPVIDDSVKLQMVQTAAQQTGMNLEWSRRCLEQNEWNFDKGLLNFYELQAKGAIPAEAFVK